jgi:hypothetical protein
MLFGNTQLDLSLDGQWFLRLCAVDALKMVDHSICPKVAIAEDWLKTR